MSRGLWLGLPLAALAAALLAQPPAVLLDGRLQEASGGKLRLARAQGTLWRGKGDLLVADGSGDWQPWQSLAWRVDAGHLWRGQVGIFMEVGGRPEARIDVSWHGLGVAGLVAASPAARIVALLPEVAGRAGWRGDLSLTVPEWHCDWSWRCTGHGGLDWQGAANDLFPDRRLGDYRLTAKAEDGDVKMAWTTLNGDIHIEGTGSWRPGTRPGLSVTVSGDAAFLERLPSVAGQWVQRGDTPGNWRVDIRP